MEFNLSLKPFDMLLWLTVGPMKLCGQPEAEGGRKLRTTRIDAANMHISDNGAENSSGICVNVMKEALC